MLKIEESAVAEVSDSLVLLMAQMGLVVFVVWLVAALSSGGKKVLAGPKIPQLNIASASKYHAATAPPAPYNQQAWQTAVGMAVSS